MKLSHNEYINVQRKRSGEIARGMLDGSIQYLEGAVELASLAFEVGLPEDDEDFVKFIGVSSEVDHLPVGEQRQYWSREALVRHEPEILQMTDWAKKFSLAACRSIAERFNA